MHIDNETLQAVMKRIWFIKEPTTREKLIDEILPGDNPLQVTEFTAKRRLELIGVWEALEVTKGKADVANPISIYTAYARALMEEVLKASETYQEREEITPVTAALIVNEIGGEFTPFIDLMEPYWRPDQLKGLLNEMERVHMDTGLSYKYLAELTAKLEAMGYTWEYGLDAIPYYLRESWVSEEWIKE